MDLGTRNILLYLVESGFQILRRNSLTHFGFLVYGPVEPTTNPVALGFTGASEFSKTNELSTQKLCELALSLPLLDVLSTLEHLDEFLAFECTEWKF